MRKKSDTEWLRSQLETVASLGRRVGTIRHETSHEYGPHTALKLAALNHCLEVFLQVARKHIDHYHDFDSAIYVDLFAGCGATRVPQTGDWLAGSPVLAAGGRLPFDKIICIEKDARNAEALEARLSLFQGREWKVLRGDCNEIARGLKASVHSKNPLVFVFVDPEGMEIHWSTLEALSGQFRCMDILFNFTYGAERVLGELRAGGALGEAIMTAFAGPDWPLLLLDRDKDVVDFVEQNISSVLGRPVGDRVLIRDIENRPRYFLLAHVRQTKGESGFFRGYRAMLGRVSALKPTEVLGTLNDIFGRSLSAFGPESDR